jgi:hypothetical protein
MVLMTQSKNFGDFMKLNQALLLKHNFILMTCSTSMQVYKKSWCREVFRSKVKTELTNHSFLDLKLFQVSLNAKPFEIP